MTSAERFLHWMQRSVVIGQALDRRDLHTLGLDAEHQTCPHGLTVGEHRTRPANPVFTTQVGSGQTKVLSKHVGQRVSHFACHRVHGPIDAEFDLHFVRHLVHGATTVPSLKSALSRESAWVVA